MNAELDETVAWGCSSVSVAVHRAGCESGIRT